MFNATRSEELQKLKTQLLLDQIAAKTAMNKFRAESTQLAVTQAEAEALLTSLLGIQDAVRKREEELKIEKQELKLKRVNLEFNEETQRLELFVISKMNKKACTLEKTLLEKEKELLKKERTLVEREKMLEQREVSLKTATTISTQTQPTTSHCKRREEDGAGFRHPFICEEVNCGSSFTNYHGLRRHSDVHAGRKYCCRRCGRNFSQQKNLNRHYRDVHMK